MELFSIAFYNTENFFDIIDDPSKFDEDFLPDGKRDWTRERYEAKRAKIARVIGELGKQETKHPPLLVGLAEIEGKRVLNDLIFSSTLEKFGYDYIHFESKDERGIDNAVLYRKDFLKVVEARPISCDFVRENGRIDYTRDLVYVQFELAGTNLHTFTVHLPSRRDDDANLEFRNSILAILRKEIDSILSKNTEAFLVVLGDFNGNPNDEFAREILNTTEQEEMVSMQLYNPMLNIGHGLGTLKHLGRWKIFDQMLFSKAFVNSSEAKFQFKSVHIYRDEKLKDKNRKFKGAPFRTFAGGKYLGGYSDHFPIYGLIQINSFN